MENGKEGRISVTDIFAKGGDGDVLYFDLQRSLAGLTTTDEDLCDMYTALSVTDSGKGAKVVTEGNYPDTTISTDITFHLPLGDNRVEASLTPKSLERLILYGKKEGRLGLAKLTARTTTQPGDTPLTGCELAALKILTDSINSGAVTIRGGNNGARNFFEAVGFSGEDEGEDGDKIRDIDLIPVVHSGKDGPEVGFRIQNGERSYVLKEAGDLVRAREDEGIKILSQSSAIDFSAHDFSEESMPFYRFIQSRIGESDMTGGKVRDRFPLTLNALDSFYDICDGTTVELSDPEDPEKKELSVGHTRMKFDLQSNRVGDAKDDFAGMAITGIVPSFLRGSAYKYTFDGEHLSRLTPKEKRVIAPFEAASDGKREFNFNVAPGDLQEFYYRVLPKLTSTPGVTFTDNCAEEARGHLSPEPIFTFFMDLIDRDVICKPRVSYGEDDDGFTAVTGSRNISSELTGSDMIRDEVQEDRVLKVLDEYMGEYDTETFQYRKTLDKDGLFDFLKDGVSRLSQYGTVKGTDAFRSKKIVRTPKFKIDVSSGSGILDLAVSSNELSKEELAGLYDSYTKKQKYHVLSDGSFVDLSDDEPIRDLEDIASSLDKTPTEVIKENIEVPGYRAVYLDRMLADHKSITADRDRTYRTLIKDFNSVKDSSFDIPKSLNATLREYQEYGYKWLKTIKTAGFGGILADDMGLGKTIQMITLFLDSKENNAAKPSLVVCPASLVYNWKEEISKFAPSIVAKTLTGDQETRAALLQDREGTDVFITSYDLLRRDIANYEGVEFDTITLDEAQYIKNSENAGTKAVKTLKADTRFALTGTPIENRLTELWSIFDFIMPGYLYTQEKFINRYQKPISMKLQGRAGKKLREMTGPFILRRLKTDVLKDLPEMIEEVRYVELSGKQKDLYDAQVYRMKDMLSPLKLDQKDRMKILSEITRARQICCDPGLLFEGYDGESKKLEGLLEFIDTAIDGGHRCLLFSQFTSMLGIIKKKLEELDIAYYEITGATPKEERLRMVHSFNDDDTPVFLISLKAGGTGLNLTGADVVIHYDPWWNMAAQNQATGRAHRMGQTRDVTVVKMIAKDTIEEKIMALQESKRDLAESILQGNEETLMTMSSEDLMKLFS